MRPRLYPNSEYTRIEGEPLSPARLSAIWGGLPEQDRLGFVLALEESIADRVIELCELPVTPAESEKPMPQPKRLLLLAERAAPVARKQMTTRSAAAVVADSERAVARGKEVLARVAVKQPTALDQLDALATKRAAVTKQTQAQAFAEVLSEQPELYDRYGAELAAGRYTEPAPAAPAVAPLSAAEANLDRLATERAKTTGETYEQAYTSALEANPKLYNEVSE